jgi:hypothetical protein
VFPNQIEEVLVRFDEFGSNFCLVVENVNDTGSRCKRRSASSTN